MSNQTFRPADLIGAEGAGSQGTAIIDVIRATYPPELEAAQKRRHNEALESELTDADYKAASKITGFPAEDIELAVRGGERRTGEAVVTYSVLTDSGVWKGCFPHAALKAGKTDDHVSQIELAGKTDAAIAHFEAQAKAEASGAGAEAAEEIADLQAKLAEAEKEKADAEAAAQEASKAPRGEEPVKGYNAANQPQIVAELAKADQDLTVKVLAYETANKARGGVLDAAQKRLVELLTPAAPAEGDGKGSGE